jgi:hypothetical protein
MIDSVYKYTVLHNVSKEQGNAHLATNVYADGKLLSGLSLVKLTINTIDYSLDIEGTDGVYPKGKVLELDLNFLSGIRVMGIYPEIVVSFEGKKINYLQSFTYSIDMTKENRLPLIHLAVL